MLKMNCDVKCGAELLASRGFTMVERIAQKALSLFMFILYVVGILLLHILALHDVV